MATKAEIDKALAALDTNTDEIKLLMQHWEEQTIPIYDRIRMVLANKEVNVILLALAAVIGQFGKDMDPEDPDSPIDMITTIAKARLFLLQQAKEAKN